MSGAAGKREFYYFCAKLGIDTSFNALTRVAIFWLRKCCLNKTISKRNIFHRRIFPLIRLHVVVVLTLPIGA